MADLRTSFATLEDSATQAGAPLHKVLEGDASAAKNASAGLVAVDPSSDLAYLKVNAAGELIINAEGEDTNTLDGYGNSAGSTSDVDVVTLTLTVDKVYKDIAFAISSFRDTVWTVVHDDDVAGVGQSNTLAVLRTGAGNMSLIDQLKSIRFTAGSIGTQELKVVGKNLTVASDMDASLQVKELI